MSVVKQLDEKPLTNNGLDWLTKRGISEKTASKIGLKSIENLKCSHQKSNFMGC